MLLVCPVMDPRDDGRHPDAVAEEWVFAAWTADARTGLLSGHRISGRRAWYWAALAPLGGPLFHVAEWDVPLRADPFIVKATALWAEHTCDAPMEQWSIGNETYAVALDEADEALGRVYGVPTPIAFDLEWYATAAPTAVEHGYEQDGVVHGVAELAGHPRLELVEVPARRWHRWTTAGDDVEPLGPLPLPPARAHAGPRTSFAFPDGTVSDLVLTADGWRTRTRSAPG
jgi:hypothetical protein